MSTSEKNICMSSICKDSDDVCDVIGKLNNMNTEDKDDVIITVCANCGKKDANNICNKCKMVKYCNAVCKKVHKKKHKKDCEEHVRLATEKHKEELRLAAELHDIELFKQPPSQFGDCPICFLRLPFLNTGRRYMSCCGKQICSGCSCAPVYDNQGNEVDEKKCAFCRVPIPKSRDGAIEREEKRVEAGDPIAIYTKGNYYKDGRNGFTQDYAKALELCHYAAELGCSDAYSSIAFIYQFGRGVEVDKKKAIHYYELSAIGGCVAGRYALGVEEEYALGNFDRALKHYMVSIRAGFDPALEKVQNMYSDGRATKDDYMKALRLHQEYLGEIKSIQRDKAAADHEDYRYY